MSGPLLVGRSFKSDRTFADTSPMAGTIGPYAAVTGANPRSLSEDARNGAVRSFVVFSFAFLLFALWADAAAEDIGVAGFLIWTMGNLAIWWAARVSELKGYRWLRWLRYYVVGLNAAAAVGAVFAVVGVGENWAIWWFVLYAGLLSYVVFPIGRLTALVVASRPAKAGSWWHEAYNTQSNPTRSEEDLRIG